MPEILTSVSIPSAGLAELKTAFESALEERKAVDARIEEIRKAIASRLQEAQALNDAASDITGSVLPKSSDSSASGTFEIKLSSIWQFFVKYALPAIIIFVVLWLGTSLVKQFKETGYHSDVRTCVALGTGERDDFAN